ncbi:hypothetical protein NB696_001766 [Xanthomonas sacchari]|uniref:hypothetical protein n=1 Tax=Xanthomonas sacchari TaxID=56458 RepID=UPI00224D99DF|nr:hypothetical protein [Xanthomonas sacchari]MCW0395722.1 hypothetical protein [Xanthomonas sacchari]MCW0444894.1 hypothetical protein [Xanthomonas sacchari]
MATRKNAKSKTKSQSPVSSASKAGSAVSKKAANRDVTEVSAPVKKATRPRLGDKRQEKRVWPVVAKVSDVITILTAILSAPSWLPPVVKDLTEAMVGLLKLETVRGENVEKRIARAEAVAAIPQAANVIFIELNRDSAAVYRNRKLLPALKRQLVEAVDGDFGPHKIEMIRAVVRAWLLELGLPEAQAVRPRSRL